MTYYQIYRSSTILCPSRDGIIGSRSVPLPMTYRSLRLAQKLAERLSQQMFDLGGDDTFTARDVANPSRAIYREWSAPDWDEIPF